MKFAGNIMREKHPRRVKFEQIKKQYKNFFKDRNWEVVKVCVYSMYCRKNEFEYFVSTLYLCIVCIVFA